MVKNLNIVPWLRNWFPTHDEVAQIATGASNVTLVQDATGSHGGSVKVYTDGLDVFVFIEGTFTTVTANGLSTIGTVSNATYLPPSDYVISNNASIQTDRDTKVWIRKSDGAVGLANNTSYTSISLYAIIRYPLASRVISNPNAVYSVTLTGDKSVLSYYDNESCTLIATCLNSSNNPVEGATVEFFKGGTSIGTSVTNVNGVATKSYSSAGVGDVSFTATVGSLVSQTYEVEDYNFADLCNIDKTANYTKCVVEGGSPHGLIFDTDKYTPTNSASNTAFVSGFSVPTNCTIEADLITVTSSNGIGIGFAEITANGKASYNGLIHFRSDAGWYNYINQSWTTSNYSINGYSPSTSLKDVWVHIKMVKTGNSVHITIKNDNDVTVYDYTKTINTSLQNKDLKFAFFINTSGNSIKNIKIL